MEFSDADNLHEEPEFKWRDNKVLKDKNKIISRVKSRFWRTSHKFSIDLLYYVEEDYAINEENGINFWRVTIDK